MEFAGTVAPRGATDDSSPPGIGPAGRFFHVSDRSSVVSMLYLYIAAGGALGALARYGLAGWVHGWAGGGFPWGTLTVNVTGAFLLGFMARLLQGLASGPSVRGFIVIGFLGAFTTFSTFSYETMALLRDGEWVPGALYAAGSVAVALVGTLLGLGLAATILRQGG